tara:strand:- start:148 stop:318 length:171 start_codon:yes stop_codon:yes gene_type:complete
MGNQLKAHKRALKNFRMICNRTSGVFMFKAVSIENAKQKAMKHFNGPVSFGGIVVE